MHKKLKRVLLVDDSDATNAMNVYMLKRLEVADHIEVTRNGQIALDYLTTVDDQGNYPTPELIILDLNMPVMNGLEFLEAYEPLDDKIKGGGVIVMLTTSIMESDRKQVEAYASVLGYQSKPLSLDKLQEMADMAHKAIDLRR